MKTHRAETRTGTKPAWRRGWRLGVLVTVAVIAGVLLLVRFALTPMLTAWVNGKLERMPEYTGYVESVDLMLWRGTVKVRGFLFFDRDKLDERPLAKVPEAFFSLSLKTLARGTLGGHGWIENAELSLLDDTPLAHPEEKSEEQKAAELETARRRRAEAMRKTREWQQALSEAFPMELDRFELKNARLRYVDVTVEPNPEIELERVNLVLTGLTNKPRAGEELPARMTFDAVVKSGGRISVDARADPLAKRPRLEVVMKVDALALPPLSAFTRTYAEVLVERGEFTVYVEGEARDGGYQGYVKPFFEELEFRSAPEEENVIKRAATAVADAVTGLLENEEEKVATQVPFQGTFEGGEVDNWTALRILLRNAFVQALREGFTGQ